MSRIPRTVLMALVVFTAAGCGADSGDSTGTTSTAPAPAVTSLSPTTSTSFPEADTTSTLASTTTVDVSNLGALLVVGDWGSGNLPQGAVAGQMMRYAEANEVAAILTTGDNFYSDDSEFLMEPYGWATDEGIPFWITWGNHDVESENRIEIIEEAFDDPPRWATYRWGNIEVVILDSTQVESDDQVEFLTGALAENQLPTVVVLHHPPYSCGSYNDSDTIQDAWVSRFDEDVFLVLSGHDHNYQRFEVSDVTYVVTGGGGATLYDLGSCPSDHPEQSAGEDVHHFLTLEQGDGVTVTAYDVNGGTIDRFTVPLR